MQEKKNKRLPYPDMMRGFAIILVVLGHCIQMGNGADYTQQELFYQDRLYQFIYTFHMPLFMLISGYFAWNSLRRAQERDWQAERADGSEYHEKVKGGAGKEKGTAVRADSSADLVRHKDGNKSKKPERIRPCPHQRSLLCRRVSSLLIPIAFWTVFEIAVAFVRTYVQIPADDPVFHDKVVGLVRIELSQIPSHFLTELWFLWAELWCFLAIYVIHRFLQDSWKAYLILELLFFITPDAWNCGVYKYMFSFYLAGYWYGRQVERKKEDTKREDTKREDTKGKLITRMTSPVAFMTHMEGSGTDWTRILLWGAFFGLLFAFFRPSVLIYLSGYRMNFDHGWHSALLSIIKDIYRFVIGMAGSIFFLLLLGKLFSLSDPDYRRIPARILTALGRQTMGIYILSGYYIIFGVSNLTAGCTPSYARNLLEMLIVLILSYYTSWLLSRVPGIRKTVGK